MELNLNETNFDLVNSKLASLVVEQAASINIKGNKFKEILKIYNILILHNIYDRYSNILASESFFRTIDDYF